MQKHMQQHPKELDELNKIEEKEKSAPKQMKQPKLFSIGAIVKVKIAVNPETQARYWEATALYTAESLASFLQVEKLEIIFKGIWPESGPQKIQPLSHKQVAGAVGELLK